MPSHDLPSSPAHIETAIVQTGLAFGNCVEAGLKTIARGFQVFALQDGTKKPLNGVSWLSLRTRNPETAKAQLKSTSSYGVATGDRLAVIDVDCRDGKPGLVNFDSLDMAYGFPETFTVRTRSGGKHLYYRVPHGMRVKCDNKGRSFGEGIDVKGHNGYVVGPGSTVEGLPYIIETDMPVADAAPWMLERLKEKQGRKLKTAEPARLGERPERNPEIDEPLCEWDLPTNIERARFFLQREASPAIEGNHGDETTVDVAKHVRDYAISEQMCFELMIHEYDQRCEPPWLPDDMRVKVANAYRYAKLRPGTRMSGLAEFEPAEILEEPKGDLRGLDIEWIRPFDPTEIPKRAWVLGRFLARGYVTELVSPPGAGKTTLELLMAVAIAAGRGDILGMEVRERTRVFVWNQEDELNELKRRLAAILKAFELNFDDITLNGKPMIILGSGASKSIKIARRIGSEEIVETKEAAALIRVFAEEGIGVAMFDPLIELHPVKESDNDQLGAVARIFRSIAIRAKCAVMLAHHTRKLPTGDGTGHFGNMESGRGASSLPGVIRMGATLYTIDDKTAKAYGVPEDERHRHVRLDDAKNNMALIGGEPMFFRREGVNIGTFNEPEEVGVLRPVELKKLKSKSERETEAVRKDLEDLLTPGEADGIPAIARKLCDIDPVMYGDDHRVVSKKITRLYEREKLPGFILEKAPGRRGSKIIRETETCQEKA